MLAKSLSVRLLNSVRCNSFRAASSWAMPGSLTFEGKGVIVTGGGSGIGAATAVAFASRGADVMIGDNNTDGMNQVIEDWHTLSKEKGGTVGSIKGETYDARDPDGVKKLADTSVSTLGKVHVLFNNAGIQPDSSMKPFYEFDDSVWDDLFNINVKSHYLMSKYIMQHMMAESIEGSIIHNASIEGLQGQKMCSGYAATKGALHSLTNTMAVEAGDFMVRVNAVNPGTVMTPLSEGVADPEFVDSRTPLQRTGQPIDIANAVLFLASDASSWITGQQITVDGGVTKVGSFGPIRDLEGENSAGANEDVASRKKKEYSVPPPV